MSRQQLLKSLVELIRKIVEVKSSAMDANIEDPKKWITANGASIPVGEGGELGGKAGEAIQASKPGDKAKSAALANIDSIKSHASKRDLNTITAFLNSDANSSAKAAANAANRVYESANYNRDWKAADFADSIIAMTLR